MKLMAVDSKPRVAKYGGHRHQHPHSKCSPPVRSTAHCLARFFCHSLRPATKATPYRPLLRTGQHLLQSPEKSPILTNSLPSLAPQEMVVFSCWLLLNQPELGTEPQPQHAHRPRRLPHFATSPFLVDVGRGANMYFLAVKWAFPTKPQ